MKIIKVQQQGRWRVFEIFHGILCYKATDRLGEEANAENFSHHPSSQASLALLLLQLQLSPGHISLPARRRLLSLSGDFWAQPARIKRPPERGKKLIDSSDASFFFSSANLRFFCFSALYPLHTVNYNEFSAVMNETLADGATVE